MHFLSNKKSFTLIASVILIVFASLVILGISYFIIERLHQVTVRETNMQAINLAEAGIHSALYQFRSHKVGGGNGHYSLGTTSVDTDGYFTLGGPATDFLMVNTSLASLEGNKNRNLKNLALQNAVDSQTIRIQRMVISWQTPGGRISGRRILRIRGNRRRRDRQRLWRVRINGHNVCNPHERSPANCLLTPVFTLNQNATLYPMELQFSGDMTGAMVDVRFIMTDGSQKDVRVYPASNNFNFAINATGKVVGSNMFRTIRAEYNTLTEKVVNYYEDSDDFATVAPVPIASPVL